MASPRKRKASPRSEDRELTDLLRRAVEPGILAVDAAGRVRGCNATAAAWLRRSAADLLNQEAASLPRPLAELVSEALRGGGGVSPRSVVLDRGAAGERTILWANAFFWEAGGGSPLLLVILHDLASARELETKVSRLQKLATLGMLSAGVVHEVKNALVAIKTYVELLLEKQPDSESATMVRREVGRIDALTSQLLRFAGPARPIFGPVQVHALLRDALRLVHPQLRSRQIEEVVLLESTGDRVNGDAKQLEQAFLNLLLNAVESMNAGGRLVVRTELVVATEHVSRFEPDRREPQIQVEIKDSGPGIPPEILSKLFHPFLTTKPGGTGLGLAITQRIVREHYGRISAETKAGHGTTFCVLLPLLRESGAETATAS